jgi:hypothetical protein
MFTCCIRYVIDLNKIKEFEEYAQTWIELIEKYGGIHHGFFLPGNFKNTSDFSFSFSALGKSGPNNVAIALFSFPSFKKYEAYRRKVSKDKKCKAATKRFKQTKCFLSYERSFLKPLRPNTVRSASTQAKACAYKDTRNIPTG